MPKSRKSENGEPRASQLKRVFVDDSKVRANP
jgi:hypothetical protein